MAQDETELIVYYDGACPRCRKDRDTYQRLAGKHAEQVRWFDISGQEAHLQARGIEPRKAMLELHLEDASGTVHSELDAYILLMRRVPLLRPLAWLISLPLLRPLLARLYHASVERRLKRSGRL